MRYYTAKDYTLSPGEKPTPGDMDGCVVEAAFVEEYIAIESRRLLFVHSGGTEEVRKTKYGVINMKSTSPDKTLRVVRFTPWFPETGGE